MPQRRYSERQGTLPGIWYVYDNQTQRNVRNYTTRDKARKAVKAYNEGRVHEVEEKSKGTGTA